MAGIVKKIGRITKYETTDYVGSARMLDLDRATASDPSIPIDAPLEPPLAEVDDSTTGEFTAVAPATHEVLANTPSIEDLLELADRHGGGKR